MCHLAVKAGYVATAAAAAVGVWISAVTTGARNDPRHLCFLPILRRLKMARAVLFPASSHWWPPGPLPPTGCEWEATCGSWKEWLRPRSVACCDWYFRTEKRNLHGSLHCFWKDTCFFHQFCCVGRQNVANSETIASPFLRKQTRPWPNSIPFHLSYSVFLHFFLSGILNYSIKLVNYVTLWLTGISMSYCSVKLKFYGYF